jgi:hypothetical protein
VYPGATNNIEKPGIQITLCIRTKKTQKAKTMATPTLPRNLRVYPCVPNNMEKPGTSRAFQKVTVNIIVV